MPPLLILTTFFSLGTVVTLEQIIIYSCCCRSAYAIDHAPTDAGGACKTPSQRTRARTTRDHTILITIQFLLPSLPYHNTKLLTSFNNALKSSLFQFSNPKIKLEQYIKKQIIYMAQINPMCIIYSILIRLWIVYIFILAIILRMHEQWIPGHFFGRRCVA